MYLQRFRYVNMKFEHNLSGLFCCAKSVTQQILLAPTTVGTNETRCGVSNLRGVREGTAGPHDVSRSPARPLAASQRKDALNARLQHLQPAIEQESVSFSVCSSRPNTLHPRVSSRPEKGSRFWVAVPIPIRICVHAHRFTDLSVLGWFSHLCLSVDVFFVFCFLFYLLILFHWLL